MKKLLKGISIFFLVLVLLVTMMEVAAKYFFHERIQKEVELWINEGLESQATFSSVTVSTIRNFPVATIIVDSLKIVEQGHEVLVIDRLFLRINPRDLINEKFIFSEVNAHGATFHSLVDSLGNKYMIRMKKNPDQTKRQFDYHIPQIDLEDVLVKITNQHKNNYIRISVDHGSFQMISGSDLISFEGRALGVLDTMISKGKQMAVGIPVSTDNGAFRIGRMDQRNLFEGTLVLGTAHVQANGVLKPIGNGNLLDIDLQGAEADLNNYLAVIPQLKDFPFQQTNPNARLSFRMKTTGYVDPTHFPNVDVDFMLTNADFERAGVDYKIRDVYLNGLYSNGKNKSAESSFLIVKEGFARIQNSFVRLSGSMVDFTDPLLNLDLESELDLMEVDTLFNLPKVANLKGKVRVKMDLEGRLSDRHGLSEQVARKFKGSIEFLDVDGDLEGFDLKLNQLTGKVTVRDENILLEQIRGKLNRSPFSLDGKVLNFMPLVDEQSPHRTRADLTADIDHFILKRSKAENGQLDSAAFSFAAFPKRLDLGIILSSRKLGTDEVHLEKVKMDVRFDHESVLVQKLHFWFQNGDIKLNGTTRFKDGKAQSKNLDLSMDFAYLNLDTLLTRDFLKQDEKSKKQGKSAFSIFDDLKAQANVEIGHLVYKGKDFRKVKVKAQYEKDNVIASRVDTDFDLGKLRSSWVLESVSRHPHLDGRVKLALDTFEVNEMRDFYTTFWAKSDSSAGKEKESTLTYKDIEIELSAPLVRHHQYQAENVKSEVTLYDQNMRLKYLTFGLFGGDFTLKGVLDRDDSAHVISTARLTARQIDATKVMSIMPQHDKSIVTKENVFGHVDVDGLLILNYDENLIHQQKDMIGRVQLALADGRLVDFRPITESLKVLNEEVTDTVLVKNEKIELLFHNDEILVPNTVFMSNLTNIEFLGYHNKEIEFGFNLKISVSDLLLKSEKKKKARLINDEDEVKGISYYLSARTKDDKLQIETLKRREYNWQEKLLQTRYKQVDVLLNYKIEKNKALLE